MSRTGNSHRNHRKDIGLVRFPIEVLIEARQARQSCIQVEALLQKQAGVPDLIKSSSHHDVMGKDPV